MQQASHALAVTAGAVLIPRLIPSATSRPAWPSSSASPGCDRRPNARLQSGGLHQPDRPIDGGGPTTGRGARCRNRGFQRKAVNAPAGDENPKCSSPMAGHAPCRVTAGRHFGWRGFRTSWRGARSSRTAVRLPSWRATIRCRSEALCRVPAPAVGLSLLHEC